MGAEQADGMSSRVGFIVSPAVSQEVRHALRQALAGYAPGSEAWQVREIAAGESFEVAIAALLESRPEIVVAVGGDGTVSAVAHALVESAVPLAIVPAGTGNLIARELEIPLDTAEAVSLIAGVHSLRRIDAMLINGHTYLLNAGVGVNAEVIDRTSRLGKTLFGRSAYVGAAVWEVLQARAQRLEICIDGECVHYDATDVLISNCGGLARVLHPNGPDIRVDDGQVDVSIVCMKVPLEYPWYYFLRRAFPSHANHIMHERPCRRSVEIKSREPIAVQADGDIIGTTPVEITVLPKAVMVVTQADQGGGAENQFKGS